jgi:hypothetical protein
MPRLLAALSFLIVFLAVLLHTKEQDEDSLLTTGLEPIFIQSGGVVCCLSDARASAVSGAFLAIALRNLSTTRSHTNGLPKIVSCIQKYNNNLQMHSASLSISPYYCSTCCIVQNTFL